MTYLAKFSGRKVFGAILIALLVAVCTGGAVGNSQADAGTLASHPSMRFTGGTGKASQASTDTLASQPNTPCKLADRNPHPPSNTINCRSTNPELKTYVYNNGDTSGCVFNLTIDWGDGSAPQNLPNYQGGPTGWELLATYTYKNAGVYTLQVTGSVVSGNCTFEGGDLQFSYILSTSPYPQGPPISAQTMLARGADWVSAQVPYSQTSTYSDIEGTYRTDCSGFVSMAWDLDASLTTGTLASVATKVTAGLNGIAPGDILLRSAGKDPHVFLFAQWANSKHTRATVQEETGKKSPTPYAVTKTFGVATFSTYTVYRYDNVTS